MLRFIIAGVAVLISALLGIIILLASRTPAPPGPPPPAPAPGPSASCDSVPLLGPDDFVGTWQAIQAAPFTGPISTFHGTIVLSNVDRDIVDDVLPREWELAELKTETHSCHPILVLFGRQTNFRFFVEFLFRNIQQIDGEYTEMMVLVPFVQRPTMGMNMHTFVARMLLDDPTAEEIGNVYYGYAKKPATFDVVPPVFTALYNSLFPPPPPPTSVWPAFRATASNAGMWEPFAAAAIPSLEAITQILAMPILGIREDATAIGGLADHCSYFELDYMAAPPASVRPVEVEHQYLQPIAPGMTLWPTLGPIDNAPGGAIEVMNVDWKLRFPTTGTCVYEQ